MSEHRNAVEEAARKIKRERAKELYERRQPLNPDRDLTWNHTPEEFLEDDPYDYDR